MPLLWAVLVGLVLGYLRGGRLGNLAALQLRWAWLLLPSLILQLLIFPLGSRKPVIPWGTPYWHILSYLFLLAFSARNWRIPELLVMGIGLIFNFLAIVANGGYMPASAEALRRAGLESVAQALETGSRSGNTVLMTENTRLNFLGDWLYLPAWMPLSSAFSLGDTILGLGVAVLLARHMVRR
ncbi:MAG: DUF5317 domain-containing protein [Candidatus Bipolaricaulota bacterium]|nr:DUF5317 domain-containing protein [Candidatus Bipolaricaulota bacterium]MDW8127556.1 DUF5317 domain-containing protein [Candidatus Bipolaricaulota bacterium]